MKLQPKAFLSYSHEDKESAIKLANTLIAGGLDVWFDKWEILPGDSLIQKIFEEGLASADVFLVLISKNSVNSKWVRQELDVALIKRIEGITRIIPIVIDGTSPPAHLRALKWVDITVDYEGAVRELQKAIFQFYEKPPIGQQPEFLRGKVLTVGGLSRVATAVGFLLVGTGKHDIGNEENFSPKELQERLGLSVEEINDAIEELENHGIVEALQELGTYPYSHSQVTPTYALFLHFKGQGLDYDPDEDIKAVAAAIVVKNKTDGNALKEVTGLSPLRLNRAVNYLKDDGIIEVLQYLGTAPFDFGEVWATGATRRFVAENCK